jgi:hypothetical protein
MRLVIVAIVSLGLVGVAASAPAHEPAAAIKRPSEPMRYRGLEKLLRRFSRQAGAPAGGKILAAR